MAQSFISKFNELLNDEFRYLVLEAVDIEIKNESVCVDFIYPELHESEVLAARDRIRAAVGKALGSQASVEVKLTKSHFDADFFKAKLLSFLDGFPSVAPYVFADNIAIKRLAEYEFEVRVSVDDDINEFISRRGVTAEVRSMIAHSYCEKVDFEFVPVHVDKPDAIELAEKELAEYVYETTDGHYVVPQNVEEFVGRIVYDRAGYISDAKREKSSVVYCGRVSDFTECERRPKDGEPAGKKFYKFTLTDPTGSLKCLYFPRKKKDGTTELNNIVNLQNGKEVVVKGSLKENSFRGNVSYDMFVNAISLCIVPEDDFVTVKSAYKSAKEYKCVKPQPYVETRQTNVFDVIKEPAAWLIGKSFCVFDLETTGISVNECKIIEIGAVKLVDGRMIEQFSTYVDPREPISERITSLTSITDADVAGAPKIEEVLPDFYKFVEGCTLVGHNVDFDYGFIAAAGKDIGITFENPKEDTWDIAKKYVKDIRNYKLGTLAKYFGVLNEHAHRAIHDAVTTAKVFVKLADYME